uniref:DNA/RNA non-specific endonuclease n=1 Tax=Lachnoclostridium phocaeense TaxID=1871021 RepID=UPI0026DD4D1A|nr:DNA/RNA non-specific endonuclease [Lachnoclostridium phocaeense]
MNKFKSMLLALILSGVMSFSGCTQDTVTTEPELLTQDQTDTSQAATPDSVDQSTSISLTDIPAYAGEPYVIINDNQPDFSEEDMATDSFETYSDLDSLGRCGVAYANIGQDLMPSEDRGNISDVKPSGWQSVEYDGIDGGYLYNRCHLIGYQLTAENANEKNLITGTRYLNVEGMLPFENLVADYIQETGNHVLYRVTPIFNGDDLVASGVQMEAKSVEDDGAGILFNVFCYNVQPGITIDYATGNSQLTGDTSGAGAKSQTGTIGTGGSEDTQQASESTYILNTNTMKFHRPDCSSVSQMSESNKGEFTGTRDELIAQGYEPCKNCNP